jgi:hypothetical protein
MGVRIHILSITASVLVIMLIIYLVRKRKLREEYSIMWLVGSVVLIVFAVWRRLLDIIAGFVGVYYAPAILLLVGIFFGVLMFLHFTVVISRQADENKTMAQEIALLKARLEELSGQLSSRT